MKSTEKLLSLTPLTPKLAKVESVIFYQRRRGSEYEAAKKLLTPPLPFPYKGEECLTGSLRQARQLIVRKLWITLWITVENLVENE